MHGLTPFDIIILFTLAGGLISGLMRGFVQEILSLGALLLALLMLRLLHGPVSDLLTGWIGSDTAASITAFGLIMGVVWGGGRFAASQMGRASRSSFIGPFDRVLGAGFGMVKALLIATTGFMLVSLAYDVAAGPQSARPEWMTKSRTYPLLSATSVALSAVIAERLREGRVDRTAVSYSGRDAAEPKR